MDNQNNMQIADHAYALAANLLINQRKTSDEAILALSQEEGVDNASATFVIESLQEQITKARKDKANKDMLYGALWCGGGIIATMADIGFIFWGAIVFGAIQFFRGVANA